MDLYLAEALYQNIHKQNVNVLLQQSNALLASKVGWVEHAETFSTTKIHLMPTSSSERRSSEYKWEASDWKTEYKWENSAAVKSSNGKVDKCFEVLSHNVWHSMFALNVSYHNIVYR